MQRREITVRGIVQGVGFRPFVYRLASRHSLTGSVRNAAGIVRIEVEGHAASIEQFLADLVHHAPALARIDDVQSQPIGLLGDREFRIEPSDTGSEAVFISPDVATCPGCLRELNDPADRRYLYAFLNGINCGPRLTILTGAPYDRAQTTMAGFPMCPQCRAEYEDPADRRFHAQPIACLACGPRLELLDADGQPVSVDDPLTAFAAHLRRGLIGALKGLGGFHLTCDAGNSDAVERLRRRKHRDEKPFAVMVRDVETAEALCILDSAERELLTSPRAPIVLLRKRPVGNTIPRVDNAVAPGNPFLGVMLPYTPLHHLLLRELDGMALVMTSGNRSDEPIAHENQDAVERLSGIADVFLVHNRPIRVRCDDSVTRIVSGVELPLRRSRSYAPQPVPLPLECPVPILAVGGQLKNTFALGRDRHAFLSHHLGDLDQYRAYTSFERDVKLYEELFDFLPECIAFDLHPDYAATRYAAARAEAMGLTPIPVQHHHAHLASCMVENGLTRPVIGVTFDGTGYGTDGNVWGGEFLVGNCAGFRRCAHLRYVPLPGGAQAIREPWRMALAHLNDAGVRCGKFESRFPPDQVRLIETILDRRINAPLTSSAGRLFDAVASLVGIRDRVTFEGQAAMELEWRATDVPAGEAYPFEIAPEQSGDKPSLVVDTRPLIRAVVEDVERNMEPARVARRFHSTLVEMIADVCCRLRDETSLSDVVLSGGVFLNALLTKEVCERLTAAGFRVHRHRLTPPNDGGLSLGQLAVAAALLRARQSSATESE
jgi:hydrogenase maturation protein HypF